MTDFSTEIWKDIPGYEGLYQASNLGRIKSLNHSMVQRWKNNKQVFHQYKGRILKGWVQNTGYLTVTLKNKKYSVHRIIALTFLQKEKGKNIINHKDGNKLNNNVNNLEWCNYKHNFDEALRLNLMNIKYNSYQNRIRAKKINQYDLQGNFIKSYSCSVDAEKELKEKGIKINARNIRNVCNGKRNKAGNYIWKYAD